MIKSLLILVALALVGCASGAAQTTGPAPTVLLEDTGTGGGTTAQFAAPDEWAIDYRWVCPASSNFGIIVYLDGEVVGTAANAIGASGEDVGYMHDAAGMAHLEIIAGGNCTWQVSARQ